MNLFYSNDISLSDGTLTDQELRHCTKVLRHQAGDTIYVMDGRGKHYEATIEHISKSKVTLHDISIIAEASSNDHLPSLAFGLLKTNDRIEWLIEKATEIGVKNIYPLYCHHCERKKVNIDRLNKIALSATKQSKQLFLPQISELMSYRDFMNLSLAWSESYIAHYHPENMELAALPPSLSQKIILIGPEGDFSKEEISEALKKGYKAVNLGKSRLRAETAGMAALVLLNNKC